MLELHGVFAGYGKRTVLQDVTLTLARGELLAVVGANGCGKSTLLKTALGLLPPKKGSILLDGTPIEKMRRQEIAVRLSYLSQGRALPDVTVMELALLGRYPHAGHPFGYGARDRAIALDALTRMGLASYVDEPIARLSGGMRQKAYLAMALAQEAQGILLDEPTSSLDVGSTLALMHSLRALATEGHAVCAVLHDLPLAFTYAHRVAVMQDGALLAVGEPADPTVLSAVTDALGVSLVYHPDAGWSYRIG